MTNHHITDLTYTSQSVENGQLIYPNTAVDVLCRALRQNDIAASVLFQAHAAETIFARGDIINVKRTSTHRFYAGAMILAVIMQRGTLSYITTQGGPFNALHCTLVQKASVTTMQHVVKVEAAHAAVETVADLDALMKKQKPPISKKESNVKVNKEFNAVRSIVKAEFKDGLDKSKGLSEFLAGRATMRAAFVHNAEKYAPYSREFELGENLGGALEDHFDMFYDGDEVFPPDLTDDIMSMKLEDFVSWLIAAARAHKDAQK